MIKSTEDFCELENECEVDHILDQIKEEFFDNRIRAYKLTKMGLISLIKYIKPDQTLEFLKEIKEQSIIIELEELKR